MSLPALPSPSTWSTSEVIKAPQLRSDVSGAVDFLACIPPVYAGALTQHSATLTTGAFTQVPLDTDFLDNWQAHNAATLATNVYPQAAGWYVVEAACTVSQASSGQAATSIIGVQNGAGPSNFAGQTVPSQSGQTSCTSACKLMQVQQTGTDYAGIAGWQSSGGNLGTTYSASMYPRISARWATSLTGTAPLPVPPLTAWPVPPAYITSAFMNANVRDTIGFLAYPPVMEAQYDTGTQSISSATSLPGNAAFNVNLDTVLFDSYSAMTTGSPGYWTAPVAGVYFCWGQVALGLGVNSVSHAAGLTITSSNYNSGSQFTYWGGCQLAPGAASTTGLAVVRRRLRLNAGDTIYLGAFQRNSASSGATIFGNATRWTSRLLTAWEGI